MREILFRGKLLNSDEWVQGSYCAKRDTTYALAEDYKNNPVTVHHYIARDEMTDWGLPNRLVLYEIDPASVGQFIGSKEFTSDKDGNVTYGKRIFDGDIIKVMSTEDGDSTYLVFWNDEKGEWDSKQLSGGCQSEDYVDAVKIIGNRIDNPEMLSQ